MRHSTRPSTGRRTALLGTAAAVALVPMSLALSTPASAAEKPAPAIIDKTLTIFDFGAGFGIPTGCQLITAVANTIAQDNGLGDQVSPVIQQINVACDEISNTAVEFIAGGKEAASSLAFINTFANPAILQFSQAVASVGADNTELIAPFGPTVAGLGGTINFFQGSDPALPEEPLTPEDPAAAPAPEVPAAPAP